MAKKMKARKPSVSAVAMLLLFMLVHSLIGVLLGLLHVGRKQENNATLTAGELVAVVTKASQVDG
jgi:hypothetical protein